MKRLAWLAVALAFASGTAHGADFKTLRHLNAPPPTSVTPLAADAHPRPLQFVRIVIQPPNGEAWALAYTSWTIRAEGDTSPVNRLMTWNSGRVQEQPAPFKNVFDEELQKAGFDAAASDSVFADAGGSADLKVGVLITDIEGRFCIDCPNLFNRDGVPGTVVMTTNWEIYSTLERKVIAKITTSGGADYKTRLGTSFLPAVYEGFRENVRQFLSNAEIRKLVTTPQGATGPATSPTLTPISLQGGVAHLSLGQAASGVAVVFAADGSGSGFLVSNDGYLITNQHVVGGTKYVKLKWSDGSETVGEVIRSDPRRDVALIKADAHGRAPLDLNLGQVQQGDAVFAIGSPLGEAQQNTMTKGIVSALREREGLPYIQSDVAVTHGNSGGPLLDDKGRVIGITHSGLAPTGTPIGLNFFIPIGDALRALSLTAPAAPSAAVAAQATQGQTARKP
ncbi:S1C family serine protease [Phenylobacterium sp.]|uniref:S1C family serine protease n=1 Tax=Phenylobacterium sp. TaxID=1871053 RepID=UPI002CE06471|nr:trypsin-like peptidase domain-containing protein [Phenylobacterium sp.]HLZ75034.1 trypsin-like peptidase domain-containing protein [Phenylobacterium sp.]